MSGGSSDSDLEVFISMTSAASTIFSINNAVLSTSEKYRGGSKPGKQTNCEFNVSERRTKKLNTDLIYRHQFDTSLFNEREFEQSRRMQQELYEKIRSNIVSQDGL